MDDEQDSSLPGGSVLGDRPVRVPSVPAEAATAMSTQSIAILALAISTASQMINFGLLLQKVIGKRVTKAEERLGVRKPKPKNPRIVHVEDIEEIRLK
jgi:hypothetical protein